MEQNLYLLTPFPPTGLFVWLDAFTHKDAASPMTSLPPSHPISRSHQTVDAAEPSVPPGRQCWPSQGRDTFESWVTASSMTSFAAGLPNLPSCRTAELPILPGRKCWPSQSADVFESWATASSMTSLPPGCRLCQTVEA